MAVLTDTGRAVRAEQIEDALATGRMEGLEPSAEGLAIFQRYVDGELTHEEMGRVIEIHCDSKYGPARLMEKYPT